jgi:hypothetical protein
MVNVCTILALLIVLVALALCERRPTRSDSGRDPPAEDRERRLDRTQHSLGR